MAEQRSGYPLPALLQDPTDQDISFAQVLVVKPILKQIVFELLLQPFLSSSSIIQNGYLFDYD